MFTNPWNCETNMATFIFWLTQPHKTKSRKTCFAHWNLWPTVCFLRLQDLQLVTVRLCWSWPCWISLRCSQFHPKDLPNLKAFIPDVSLLWALLRNIMYFSICPHFPPIFGRRRVKRSFTSWLFVTSPPESLYLLLFLLCFSGSRAGDHCYQGTYTSFGTT